jgi:cytochrome P450
MNIFPSPEQRLFPFEFYSMMRRSNPVAYDEINNVWGVFRYDDVLYVITNHAEFSSANNSFSSSLRPGLLQADPPYHKTLRSVISKAFTPTIVAKLKPRIDAITHTLLNRVVEKGRLDLINDLAYPLPVTIIAELLGVPIQDRELFHRWADALHYALNAGIKFSMSRTSDQGNASDGRSDNNLTNITKIQEEMDSYFDRIVQDRIKEPKEDLITNLVNSRVEGHSLSNEEILTFCRVLLVAGHVTTYNLIGNTILSLLQNPEQFHQLKQETSLIAATVTETLRYRSPVQAVNRVTTKAVKVGGKEIGGGQRIIAWIGSANHDESKFTDPERFDIRRSIISSNSGQSHPSPSPQHLAFGQGIHYCLGAPLADLEVQVVLKVILQRLHGLTFDLDDDAGNNSIELEPIRSTFFHGLAHLPLRFEASVSE